MFYSSEINKEKNQNKTWTYLMLWHLDQYLKVKQGVSILKTYIGNTDRAPILPTYRSFLSSWSSFRGNEIPAPKNLSEIYNEPIFFNTISDGVNNPSVFLDKTLPAWAKGLFITIKDHCPVTSPSFITAGAFIESYTLHKHIRNPRCLDYLEILKFTPMDW